MLLKLARGLAAGAVFTGCSAASAESYQMTTEHWAVQLGDKEKACYATSVSPSGGIILHSDRDNDRLFILGDDAVRKLERNKRYPAPLKIDGETWSLSSYVTDKDINFGSFELTAILWGNLPRRFLDAMRSGRELTGAVGGVALEAYSLKGSRQALDYLDECLTRLR